MLVVRMAGLLNFGATEFFLGSVETQFRQRNVEVLVERFVGRIENRAGRGRRLIDVPPHPHFL